MADRSRAKETTVLFSVEGLGTLGGSFVKTTDFKLTPDAEITATKFLGQAEADYDLEHSGWRGSCTVHEVGPDVRKVYLALIAANNAGLPRPKVVVTLTTRYRDGATPPFVQKLGSVVLKLDDFDVTGGEFIKNSLSFAASLGGQLTGAT